MASRFWVGGTGNWDAADTSHWSASSGGTSGASVPTSADTVTFNGSSGGGTCTVTATANCSTLTTGAFTGTLNFNGQTINIGTGGWSATGSGTRTITCGSSTINISSASTAALDLFTTTNQTWNHDTSTIVFTGNGAGISFTISSSSFTFYNVTFTAGGGAVNTLAGRNYTFNNLTVTGSANKTCGLVIPDGKTITVNGTLTLNGNSAINRLLISSNTVGTSATISIASAPTITNSDFMDITGSGAGSWNISGITGNSGDCGGNSGITFTTAATQTATGTASFTWSTHGWTSRVPLPQDDVVVNNAFIAGRTVTADMPRLGKSITFGCTGSPTLSITATTGIINGSLDLTGVATYTSTTNTLAFYGRTTCTFTTAGLNINSPILLRAPSGTLQLADNLAQGTATSRSFSLRAGALDLNGKTLTNFGTFIASFTDNTTRSITGNSGTIDLTLNTATTVFSGGTSNFTTSGIFTIKISGSTTNARIFSGQGATYYNLWFSNATGAGQLNILGSNTFNDIKCIDTNVQTIKFQTGTTNTVTTFTVTGAAANLIVIDSCTSGGAASTSTHTLSAPSKSNADPISCDYLNIQHSIATQANTWYAGTHSTDNQATATAGSGWIFTAPAIVSANKLLALLGVG